MLKRGYYYVTKRLWLKLQQKITNRGKWINNKDNISPPNMKGAGRTASIRVEVDQDTIDAITKNSATKEVTVSTVFYAQRKDIGFYR